MIHEIRFADTTGAIRRCFPAISSLRQHLDEEQFLAQVQRQQQDGYRLVFLQAADEVPSVAGFRILEYLAWGRILYIDDLVTMPRAQCRGYGGQLLRWLVEHARAHGCAAVHLDSGYQRHDAHRLYLNHGFRLSSHHFALSLQDPAS